VLLPLTLATAVLVLLIAAVLQLTLLAALKVFAVCALALHGGYVLGSMVRFWLLPACCTGVCASVGLNAVASAAA
jgi:hypothetical protein